MFKCFNSAKRAKDDKDPKDWDAFFAEPSTEGYLQTHASTNAESSKSREDAHTQAPSAQAGTAGPAHRSEHKDEPAHSSLTAPPNTATRGGPSSSTSGSSHFGNTSATAPATPYTSITAVKNAYASFGTYAGSAPAARPNGATMASPSVSTDSGTFHDDHDNVPKASGFPAPPAPKPAGAGGFAGFGGSDTYTTAGFDGFKAAPACGASAFGVLPAALGGGGSAAKRATPTPPSPPSPPPVSGRGGFHGFGGSTKPAPFSPLKKTTTATDVGAKLAPATAAARMFQSAMGGATRPGSDSISPPKCTDAFANLKIAAAAPSTTIPKSTVAAAPSVDGGFSGFGTSYKPAATVSSGFNSGLTSKAPSFAPSTSSTTGGSGGFSGFGTSFKPAPTVPSSTAAGGGFTGFSSKAPSFAPSTSSTMTSSTAGSGGFSGFGTVPRDTVAAAPFSQAPMVRMNFGTLHVSGPPAMMQALADRDAKEKAHALALQQQQQLEDRKRVRFAEREMSEERQAVAESGEETETEDEAAQARPRPWGRRPNFRKMLEGGNKKLVLADPPKGVIDYFKNQVKRSYGCCYDHVSTTFYATSPGIRRGCNGEVVAFAGNCKTPPFLVAGDLDGAAAIAVYEPGLSVCVVTDKGIFVLTRRDNAKGEMDKFISRQISRKTGHRGICTTANGGIISFGAGKIRLFDGGVQNGQENVLAETTYDSIINEALFADLSLAHRRRSGMACFMDIVENRLVMSDLVKHVVSLWEVDEQPGRAASIKFVRAIDVASGIPDTRGPRGYTTPRVPLGKCAFASGIRLDEEGWVMCADAEGRTIQVFDNELKFVTRLETPGKLPYISGLYIEKGGHIMVCDRQNEMGGLRVYMMEAVEKKEGGAKQQHQQQPPQSPAPSNKSSFAGFAAAARLQGGRF